MGDAPDVISFIASKARKHRRIAGWNPLGQINRLRPLIEFDASSPRVGDECNPDANAGTLARPDAEDPLGTGGRSPGAAGGTPTELALKGAA